MENICNFERIKYEDENKGDNFGDRRKRKKTKYRYSWVLVPSEQNRPETKTLDEDHSSAVEREKENSRSEGLNSSNDDLRFMRHILGEDRPEKRKIETRKRMKKTR